MCDESYYNQMNRHAYSSLSLMPAYSFGKNQSRDAVSHMKAVIKELNRNKQEKDRMKKERLQVYTLGEYHQEEQLKRAAAAGNLPLSNDANGSFDI